MNTVQQWDNLCAKYESAQDENTTAYLAISAHLLTGGGNVRTSSPIATELARWDASRARVRNIDERMRSFVTRLISEGKAGEAGGHPARTKGSAELH